MADKSVRKDDSEPRYKIEFMYKEYDGEYTAEECGKNVEVMLKDVEPTRLYNPHFTFYRTDAGFKASAKKSQSEPESFSEMVQKQRNKNVRKAYPEDLTDEQAQTFEGYRLWANSIGDEIWEVVRSVTGMRSRCDMELGELWKEVSDLLIQAKEKADALANIGIELN